MTGCGFEVEEQPSGGDQLLQHLGAARAAQDELAEVFAGTAEPQAAQDRQVFVGDEFGLLEERRFHVGPRLVDFDDRAVRVAARAVQHDLVAHVEVGPVQPVRERLGARGARRLRDRIGGFGAGAETLEPAHQFGAYAGWLAEVRDRFGPRVACCFGVVRAVTRAIVLLDVVDVVHLVVILELGEQQRGNMLAVAADRAGAVALRPRRSAIGAKAHPRSVRMRLRALHVAAERVAVPLHVCDCPDRARLGNGVITEPFRNPFPIEEN